MYEPENTVLINTKKVEKMTENTSEDVVKKFLHLLLMSNDIYIPSFMRGAMLSPVSISNISSENQAVLLDKSNTILSLLNNFPQIDNQSKKFYFDFIESSKKILKTTNVLESSNIQLIDYNQSKINMYHEGDFQVESLNMIIADLIAMNGQGDVIGYFENLNKEFLIKEIIRKRKKDTENEKLENALSEQITSDKKETCTELSKLEKELREQIKSNKKEGIVMGE